MDSSAFVFLFYQLDYVLLPSLPRQMQGGVFSCLCALTARNFDSFAQKSDNLSHKQWENAEYIFFSRKQNRRNILLADSF